MLKGHSAKLKVAIYTIPVETTEITDILPFKRIQ